MVASIAAAGSIGGGCKLADEQAKRPPLGRPTRQHSVETVRIQCARVEIPAGVRQQFLDHVNGFPKQSPSTARKEAHNHAGAGVREYVAHHSQREDVWPGSRSPKNKRRDVESSGGKPRDSSGQRAGRETDEDDRNVETLADACSRTSVCRENGKEQHVTGQAGDLKPLQQRAGRVQQLSNGNHAHRMTRSSDDGKPGPGIPGHQSSCGGTSDRSSA